MDQGYSGFEEYKTDGKALYDTNDRDLDNRMIANVTKPNQTLDHRKITSERKPQDLDDHYNLRAQKYSNLTIGGKAGNHTEKKKVTMKGGLDDTGSIMTGKQDIEGQNDYAPTDGSVGLRKSL